MWSKKSDGREDSTEILTEFCRMTGSSCTSAYSHKQQKHICTTIWSLKRDIDLELQGELLLQIVQGIGREGERGRLLMLERPAGVD